MSNLPWRVIELLEEHRETIERVHGEDVYKKARAGELDADTVRSLTADPEGELPTRVRKE